MAERSSYADVMGGDAAAEQAALVALLRTRPERLSWAEITAQVLEAGSALAVWRRLVPPALVGTAPDEAEQAAADLEHWAGRGLTVLTVLDARYPARLRAVHQAPPILFGRGTLVPGDPAVCVVGSRDASERGLAMAGGIARALAGQGVTVTAGLALGIDTAAHRATLAAGGRTVAIIGTGINRVYPAGNRALHEEIAVRGLLLSQFWPDAQAQRHTFLMRNATMSGYGLATVVVEAGEHSGARAQARIAVGHGRPVILTDLVVQRNEWARALMTRPGVYVADSLDAVTAILGKLIAGSAATDAALRQAVSG
jgi:DNA processing protein